MSWTGDDSSNVSVDGAVVSFGGGSGKANAIYAGGDVSGVACWEFEVKAGQGMWVGLGTEENFGSGYKLKELLYGGPGNLSDGGALLQGNWGPRFGEGDRIGMRLETSGVSTNLAFSRNGDGLGQAFDIQGWNGGSNLRPIVSLDNKGQSVKIQEVAPGTMEAFTSSGAAATGLAGSWCQGEGCSLSISPEGPGKWRLAAKVANSISCSVSEGAGGSVSVGAIMSTEMMPPPHLQEKEESISQLLSGLTGMSREGGCLKLTAGDRSEVFTVAPGPGPVSKDRVRWIQ